MGRDGQPTGKKFTCSNRYFNGEVNINDEHTLRPVVIAAPYTNQTIAGRPGCSSVNTAALFRMGIVGTVQEATVGQEYTESVQDFEILENMIAEGNAGGFTGDVFE